MYPWENKRKETINGGIRYVEIQAQAILNYWNKLKARIRLKQLAWF